MIEPEAIKKPNGRTRAHLLGGVPIEHLELWREIQKDAKKSGSMYTIQLRGRGSRQQHGDQSDIALEHATHFAVYVRELESVRRRTSEQRWKSAEFWAERKLQTVRETALEQSRTIDEQRAEIEHLQAALDHARMLLDNQCRSLEQRGIQMRELEKLSEARAVMLRHAAGLEVTST